MKKHLKSIITLTLVCAIVAVLLSAVNAVSAPIIEKRSKEEAEKALLQVMPNGKNFTKVEDLSFAELDQTITALYSEEGGGYIFEITTKGYASGLVIMCGVDQNGVVTGATCLASNETNKKELTYGENFKNKTLEQVSEVDTIASSTKTTSAYKNAVKVAVNAALTLKENKGGTANE